MAFVLCMACTISAGISALFLLAFPPSVSSHFHKHHLHARMEMEYQQLQLSLCFLFLLPLIHLIFRAYGREGFSLKKNAHRLPPSPPKFPIIGHLHLLSRHMPHLAFTNLSARLGPIIHLQLGHIPTIVLSSPRLVRDVFKTHDLTFSTRPQPVSAHYLSFGCTDITFSPYGAYWRQVRKICITELLSSRRVHSFKLVRHQEVTRLLRSLPPYSSPTNMSERFFSLANDILCRVAFGRRFADGAGGGDAGHGLKLNEVLAETQALLAGFSIGDFFPGWEWVNWVSGLKGRLERNMRDLRIVCDEIIKEHVLRNTNDDEEEEDGFEKMREDFVDVLLRIQKSDDLDLPITNDNLKALVSGMPGYSHLHLHLLAVPGLFLLGTATLQKFAAFFSATNGLDEAGKLG